jgi:nucleotide-binding universal stress UspA family protein
VTPFSSILVPLDGSAASVRGLACAAWLASRLGAALHVLSATPRPLPAQEELARLDVPEAHWPLVTLHQVSALPEAAILDAVARYGADLIVMSGHGQDAEARGEPPGGHHAGHVTRAIAEGAGVPVLVLPPRYVATFPWDRVITPVSGEPETDVALALAVDLARALGLALLVAHVVSTDERPDLSAHARYVDAPQHELPQRLTELVEQAARGCTDAARRCIQEVALGRGDVATELIALVEERGADLLVLGWHGSMSPGRADVVKRLFERVRCAMLLVPAAPAPRFRLRVGEDVG